MSFVLRYQCKVNTRGSPLQSMNKTAKKAHTFRMTDVVAETIKTL